ncbi:hypothetical protein PR003_g20815 [Phytophthora rubi]|uniref:Peptidase S9 prolyl oligopeptidase catalytic domain-containing protein n=1 Tax=Phytophthora rubi TaxID=129364 RepID=A0A6A3JN07_9STRA|nr:hypothetical protein PR002_g20201 [Phytophthora rubi]KAE8996749.1 hypothetical protein PR001_g19772 [Phytophthora rubi]KAE9308132.1 hypothetical protein PR003_g20815 [Phytophthora rubi]
MSDNFYRSNKVSSQPITFQNQFKMTVAANLFIPKDLDTSVPAPAIVVGHRCEGANEGEPRNVVSPDLYAETFSAAVDYLTLQDFIDPERIGALGICGSGSFVISAARIDSRIKAVATSSMYDMGAVNRNVHVHELTPDTPDIQREFYYFYRTSRGEYMPPPGSMRDLTTHPTLSSMARLMNFYPFNDIDTISPRPMQFVSGDQAHSREFSEDAYAGAAEPKELYCDLYDRVDLIPFAKFAEFFENRLAVNNTATQ